MVASAEVITADSEKYVEQLLELFRRFSLLVSQVKCSVVEQNLKLRTFMFRVSAMILVF